MIIQGLPGGTLGYATSLMFNLDRSPFHVALVTSDNTELRTHQNVPEPRRETSVKGLALLRTEYL